LKQEQIIMSVERKKRIQRDWAVVFEGFHQSGMTIQEFCRSQGISQSLFYRHRKKHLAEATPVAEPLQRSDFIALKRVLPSAGGPSASIVFGNSIQLSIHNDCDPELVLLLLSQLKGLSC
jgi:hypothetical protein